MGGSSFGLFMNIVRRAFALKYRTEKFLLDHEYRVLTDKKYAVDEAVAALTQLSKDAVRNVVLAVQYKPKVAKELEDQTAFHVSEVLLSILLEEAVCTQHSPLSHLLKITIAFSDSENPFLIVLLL